MLADNVLFLRKEYPDVYQVIKAWEEAANLSMVLVETAKDGHPTLKYVNDDQTVYLHSKYNPIREAETIIDKLTKDEDINDQTHVVFYGLGFGYHIESFVLRFPTVSFSIIEPSPEILANYLNHKDIRKGSSKKMRFLQCGNQVGSFFDKVMQQKNKQLVICELPAYLQIFKEAYDDFLRDFKQTVQEQRLSLQTILMYKKRWFINSVNNFKIVLTTPNIILESNDFFEGKNALLVAAGPSLDLEIENLRKIKELGMAYIFSVGSAINTLIHHGIEPDAMCTYDPSEENQMVFKKINELGINSIPMIFGSSVGYEALKQYPGPKYHMISNQDTIAYYFLKTVNQESIEMVNDASSISIVTLELLVKLGFSKIILVGQNLAYLEDQIYSSEIDYITDEITKKVLSSEGLVTESVDGNRVKTSRTFLSMKKQLEQTIEKFSANVVNTTVGGAKIEGTYFKLLNQLITEDLTNSNTKYPIERIEKTKQYDHGYALSQMENLKKAYQSYLKIISDIKNCLIELHELIRLNQENEAHQTHLRMDKQIKMMEANDFFKMSALPINRVEYGLLVNEIKTVGSEKNHFKKIKSVIKPTENFIDLLYTQIGFDNRSMLVLENIIRDFA